MIWRVIQRIRCWYHTKRNGPPRFGPGDEVFAQNFHCETVLFRIDFGPFEGIVTKVEVGMERPREWMYEVTTKEEAYTMHDGSKAGPHITFMIRESQLSPSISARRNEILEELGI